MVIKDGKENMPLAKNIRLENGILYHVTSLQ